MAKGKTKGRKNTSSKACRVHDDCAKPTKYYYSFELTQFLGIPMNEGVYICDSGFDQVNQSYAMTREVTVTSAETGRMQSKEPNQPNVPKTDMEGIVPW